MKRTTYILLGLLLFAGAAGVFAWRVGLYEPQQTISYIPPAPDARSATRGPEGEAAPRSSTEIPSDPDGMNDGNAGFKNFEMAIDIINMLVGLIGIALAIMGLRMHREAREMTQSMGGMKQKMRDR